MATKGGPPLREAPFMEKRGNPAGWGGGGPCEAPGPGCHSSSARVFSNWRSHWKMPPSTGDAPTPFPVGFCPFQNLFFGGDNSVCVSQLLLCPWAAASQLLDS